MMIISLISLMAAAGRMHGIGGIPGGRVFAKLIVGLSFGIGAVALWGYLWMLPMGAISAWAFSTGHGNFYEMRGYNPLGDGPEKLEVYFALPIWRFLGWNIYTPAYSWFCMGLKWFLVSLIIFPYSVTMAWIAAASYSVSFSYTKSSALAEWLTTTFAGLIIAYLCLEHYDELVTTLRLGADYVGVTLGN